jgi:hypothetical protein
MFCSNICEKSNNKRFICRDCRTIRDYIRNYGIKKVLNMIELHNDNCKKSSYNNGNNSINIDVDVLKNEK